MWNLWPSASFVFLPPALSRSSPLVSTSPSPHRHLGRSSPFTSTQTFGRSSHRRRQSPPRWCLGRPSSAPTLPFLFLVVVALPSCAEWARWVLGRRREAGFIVCAQASGRSAHSATRRRRRPAAAVSSADVVVVVVVAVMVVVVVGSCARVRPTCPSLQATKYRGLPINGVLCACAPPPPSHTHTHTHTSTITQCLWVVVCVGATTRGGVCGSSGASCGSARRRRRRGRRSGGGGGRHRRFLRGWTRWVLGRHREAGFCVARASGRPAHAATRQRRPAAAAVPSVDVVVVVVVAVVVVVVVGSCARVREVGVGPREAGLSEPPGDQVPTKYRGLPINGVPRELCACAPPPPSHPHTHTRTHSHTSTITQCL